MEQVPQSPGLKVIVMGVSGCGKSSLGTMLALHLNVPFIEGDILHPVANIAKMSAGFALTDEDRWPWLDRVGAALRDVSKGQAVAACSALRFAYRERLRQQIAGPILFLHLHGDPKVLFHRMSRRDGHFMPSSLLKSQLCSLELPNDEQGIATLDIEQQPAALLRRAVELVHNHTVHKAGPSGDQN